MEKSQSKNISIVTIEKMVFAAIWIMLFSLPFLLQQSATAVLWGKVFVEWLRIFSFFVIFIVNIAVFVPRLLFRKKYSQYIVAVLFLISIVNFTSSHIRFRIIDPLPVAMPRMELGPGMPPMELGQNMPAPKGYRPPQVQEKPYMKVLISKLNITTKEDYIKICMPLEEREESVYKAQKQSK